MGKSSVAKKKRKGLTAQEKIVRKEVNRLDAKRNAMWHDHMDSALEALTPVFEESTFVQMLYFSLLAANSRFGFGKKRLTVLADAILEQYDALNKDYVSLTDMVEEIYRITGERYVLTEADIYDRWKKGCSSFGVLLESVKPFSKERY